MQTIRELIDRQAAERGDAPFLLSPETAEVVTFGTLRDRAQAVGRGLAALGLPKGARVAALLDNGLVAAEFHLGTLYAARVPVLLNPQASASHTAYSLAHSEAGAVFATPGHAPFVRKALGDPPRPRRACRLRHELRVERPGRPRRAAPCPS